MQKPIPAVQLYTLRDHIQTAEDFDATLARLHDWGVRDVQISAIGDIPAEIQRDILNKHAMRVCVTHKNFNWLREDPQRAIDHHKTIGCSAIGIGAAPESARCNTGNVRRFIAEVNELARVFHDAGMTFHYHNHAFEFQKLDDHAGCIMDFLLEETDPACVCFIPDLMWMHYAGRDPVEVLQRMRGRVKVVHFKDYFMDREGFRRFCSLGQGIVDLRSCYDAVCELEMPYIAYEQDGDWTDGDPFRAAEESWAFLKALEA